MAAFDSCSLLTAYLTSSAASIATCNSSIFLTKASISCVPQFASASWRLSVSRSSASRLSHWVMDRAVAGSSR